MMQLSKGLIQGDILTAKQAIDYYEKRKNKNIKNVAAYHLQQAAEKLIKIQIYRNIAAPDYSKLYVHNLEKLIEYAESLGIEIIVPDYVRKNSLLITGWEAGSRYDICFSIRIDAIKKAYDVIAGWYRQIK